MEISYASQTLRALCLGSTGELSTAAATEGLHAVLADLRAARVLGDLPRRYALNGAEALLPIGQTGWEIVASFDHLPGDSPMSAERIKIMIVREVLS